jgi:alpha-N-arabinofuranosidase
MDSFIEEVVAIADAVAARRRSARRIMLSFDEWNVWYRTRRHEVGRILPGWPVAPPILEEIYNVQDALAFGGAAISLLNHADRVRCACLAQLVNVIAPIMTETGGPAWRQTIFFPFAQFSNFGRGTVLRTLIETDSYAAEYHDPRGPHDPPIPLPSVPYLKLAAVRTAAGGLNLFALNRDVAQPMRLDLEARSFPGLRLADAQTLHHTDLNAVNTKEAPNRVRPVRLTGVKVTGSILRATLPAASWTLLRLVPVES